MTYDQLLTIDAIVRFGSFKAASEALHKSQPSLSISIKKLEEQLGFELFSREDYRPRLTEKGLAFYQKSKLAMAHYQSLEIFAKELSMGFESQIKVSLDAVCPIQKFRDVLANFFEPQVSTTLDISIEVLEGLTEKVINSECDFGIGSYLVEDSRIEAIELMKVKMIPVIHGQFYQQQQGSLEELSVLPQIIIKSSSKKRSPTVVGVASGMRYWYTTDLSMKVQLIENGLGWGRLPEHLIEHSLLSGKLVVVKDIPSIKTIEVPLFLLRNKEQIMGPNTKKLWNYLIEISK